MTGIPARPGSSDGVVTRTSIGLRRADPRVFAQGARESASNRCDGVTADVAGPRARPRRGAGAPQRPARERELGYGQDDDDDERDDRDQFGRGLPALPTTPAHAPKLGRPSPADARRLWRELVATTSSR